MTTADPVEELTAVLRLAKALPRLSARSVTASSIYDPLYRVIVIALAMRLCGKGTPEGPVTMSGPKLKLFQFVAIHRDLLPSLRGWVSAHERGERPSLDGWARFPRGSAADSLYERVTTYLIAIGAVRREGKNLIARIDDKKSLFAHVLAVVDAGNYFSMERETLGELATLRVTLGMLDA